MHYRNKKTSPENLFKKAFWAEFPPGTRVRAYRPREHYHTVGTLRTAELYQGLVTLVLADVESYHADDASNPRGIISKNWCRYSFRRGGATIEGKHPITARESILISAEGDAVRISFEF